MLINALQKIWYPVDWCCKVTLFTGKEDEIRTYRKSNEKKGIFNEKNRMNRVFVVSDGTGRTADQALRAALTQFPQPHPEIVLRASVQDLSQVESVILEAAMERSFIVHTLVSEQLREEMARLSRVHNVTSIDLIGPMLSRLAVFFDNSPVGVPGLFHTLNREYFKRIDAMQFAINHDDGQRDHEYSKAEIVLVGVSRTFKTPMSMYLAFKGWFVANYPIVLDMELPESLFSLPKGNVIGLMTQPYELSGLREADRKSVV